MSSEVIVQAEADETIAKPRSCKVRDALFNLMRELGITKIFGNVGSTEEPMLQDFPPDFEYVLALQESVAVAMADAYSQATGKLVDALTRLPETAYTRASSDIVYGGMGVVGPTRMDYPGTIANVAAVALYIGEVLGSR